MLERKGLDLMTKSGDDRLKLACKAHVVEGKYTGLAIVTLYTMALISNDDVIDDTRGMQAET